MSKGTRYSPEVRERAMRMVPKHENRELRRANEILRKALVDFARAELDRRAR